MQASTAALASSNKLGNRLVAIRGGLPETYTPTNLNQYSDIDGVPQTHDVDGNLTDDGTATYTYDAENRLTQVVTGATTVQFTYDPFGRRASKTVNGVVTKFFYDGDDLIVETGNDPNALIARYLVGPGLDEPLELKRGSTISYYSADGLGSIVHLTNAAGNIIERYTYETFGKLTIKNASGTELPTSAFGNRFTFTGREWDSETGLYFYRTRYRSPKTGSFLSRDPLGYLPDVNLYRYVKNNPTNFVDPSGYFVAQIVGGVVGAIVGGLSASQVPGATKFDVLQGIIIGSGTGVLSTIPIPGINPLLTGAAVGLVGNLGAQFFVENKSFAELDPIAVSFSVVAGVAGAAVGVRIKQIIDLGNPRFADALEAFGSGLSSSFTEVLLQLVRKSFGRTSCPIQQK